MKTILLVEDDDLFAEVCEKTLIGFGYAVTRARNGNEALKLFDPLKVDLVLTDLIMPDKEGLELIQELHHAHPAVKIIAMSGGGRNNPQVFLKAAQQFGAMQILTKPFPLASLAKAVWECLEKPGPG